jgi:hypothetical protein
MAGEGNEQESGSGGLSGGAISGIVIAIVIAGAAAAAGAAWWFCGKRRPVDTGDYPVAEMDHVTVDDFDAWVTGGEAADDLWPVEPSGGTEMFMPHSSDDEVVFGAKFE